MIYDVGNGVAGGTPAHPVLLSTYATSGGEVHNAWWFWNPITGEKKYLFIGQEGPGMIGISSVGDIHVVDVSVLTHPVEVAFFHTDSAGAHNVWVDEQHQVLYSAYYNAGVVSLDVSGTLSGDLSARGIDTLAPGGAGDTYTWGVQPWHGSLYAIDMLSGLWRLSESAGHLAVAGGGNNVPTRYSSDLSVDTLAGYAYTGTWDHVARTGLAGSVVSVWQLDSAGAPTLVDTLQIASVGAISDVRVSPDGKLLMFSTESGSGSGFYFYSLASPAHPTFLAYYPTGAEGVHTAKWATIGGRLYAFGAKNPGNPALIILDVTALDH
jgi:hypothetical protein